jgi:hypothetical protein
MTANYSSMAGVAAMFLVIAVVLISAIYPSKVAANIAIPDVNRSWKMPDPEGNELVIMLPFLIKLHMSRCAPADFVYDYYIGPQRHVPRGLFHRQDHTQCDFACPMDKERQLPMDGMPNCFG